jgi:hypothetical protein
MGFKSSWFKHRLELLLSFYCIFHEINQSNITFNSADDNKNRIIMGQELTSREYFEKL